MKRKLNNVRIAGFLTFIIVCFGFNFGAPVSAQETGRERILEKPTPTPTQTPTANPTFSPTPIFTPTPVPIHTLTSLEPKIRFTLARPELSRGTIRVVIVSLDTGKTVFESNS